MGKYVFEQGFALAKMTGASLLCLDQETRYPLNKSGRTTSSGTS